MTPYQTATIRSYQNAQTVARSAKLAIVIARRIMLHDLKKEGMRCAHSEHFKCYVNNKWRLQNANKVMSDYVSKNPELF